MSAHPSVLLLEDDASVQRFVQLALEDLPLQLHCSASLAQAREVLRRQPVQLLLACVEQALAPSASSRAPCAPPPATDPVQTFFGGQQALYQAYRQTCLAQFEHDLAQGTQAAQAGDCTALRHLGHNLKSVLTLLGHDGAAQQARTLEAQASAPDLAAATHSWQQLARALQQLR